MEKLEVTGPWSGTKGGSVDPKGEMGHGSAWVKAARGGVEKLKEAEMAPPEESAEIQSSKRKVIRAESEETQDYVCETLAISQEETQEIAFVPSALSESRGPIHWCDNRCSENAARYWQIASVVVDEGGEVHTINLRQQCYNEQMVQQGKPRLKSWQWRAVAERKVHRGRIWKAMENEQFIQRILPSKEQK